MTAAAWIPIRYREFYDIPRSFVISYDKCAYLFACEFDDALDEYPDAYQIYRIEPEHLSRVDQDSWTQLADAGTRIGVIPTRAVRFDSTRRKAVEASIVEFLADLQES